MGTFSAALTVANIDFWSIGRTFDLNANKYVTLAKVDEVRISRIPRVAPRQAGRRTLGA